MNRRLLVRLAALSIPIGFFLWLTCGWLTIQWITAPRHTPIGPIPALGTRTVVDVFTTTDDGVTVRGWLVRASDSRIVIVFAGYGGNRTSNLGLAEFYLSRGLSVLLPDLRATGESGGDQIGFGWLEREDVSAWVRFAKSRGFTDIALHGQSMGAAAITYSLEASSADYSFLVLDSCYDDIHGALYNRLSWIPIPQLTLKPIEWFGSSVIGASTGQLRPVDYIKAVACPILFIAGDQDPRVLPAETERLFAACPAKHKYLKWMKGGHHENLWIRFSSEYSLAMDEFLKSGR